MPSTTPRGLSAPRRVLSCCWRPRRISGSTASTRKLIRSSSVAGSVVGTPGLRSRVPRTGTREVRPPRPRDRIEHRPQARPRRRLRSPDSRVRDRTLRIEDVIVTGPAHDVIGVTGRAVSRAPGAFSRKIPFDRGPWPPATPGSRSQKRSPDPARDLTHGRGPERETAQDQAPSGTRAIPSDDLRDHICLLGPVPESLIPGLCSDGLSHREPGGANLILMASGKPDIEASARRHRMPATIGAGPRAGRGLRRP